MDWIISVAICLGLSPCDALCSSHSHYVKS